MSRPRPRVVAIGDAIVDLVTPPMSRFPAGDFQGEVRGFDSLPGGNATNFALAIARLGARTTFVGAVGVDPTADIVCDAYRRAGVRALLRRTAQRPTGTTMALTWSDGRRTLITAPGANASLRPRDVPIRVLRSAQHVHRAGFWWTPGLLGTATAKLLRLARRSGAATSLDVSADPRGWPCGRVAAVRSCLSSVDTFFGNEGEICAIAGVRPAAKAAECLLALGVGEVVIHQGERGSTGVTPSNRVRCPAFDVGVDNPTGCGDVFNAGYVHTKLTGGSVGDALRVGNATAALHLRDRRHPYPSARDVQRFLRRFA